MTETRSRLQQICIFVYPLLGLVSHKQSIVCLAQCRIVTRTSPIARPLSLSRRQQQQQLHYYCHCHVLTTEQPHTAPGSFSSRLSFCSPQKTQQQVFVSAPSITNCSKLQTFNFIGRSRKLMENSAQRIFEVKSNDDPERILRRTVIAGGMQAADSNGNVENSQLQHTPFRQAVITETLSNYSRVSYSTHVLNSNE